MPKGMSGNTPVDMLATEKIEGNRRRQVLFYSALQRLNGFTQHGNSLRHSPIDLVTTLLVL